MFRLFPLRRSFSLDLAPDDSNSNFLHNNDDVNSDTPSSTTATETVTSASAMATSPSTPLPVSNHISAAHQILLNKSPHTPLFYSNMGWTPASADMDEAIATDFDGTFSGINMDLATAAPFMSDALMALPTLSDKLKQHTAAYHHHHHNLHHSTNPGAAVEYLNALNAATVGNSLSAMVRTSGELHHLHHSYHHHHTTSDRFATSTSPTPSGQSGSSTSENESVPVSVPLLLSKKGARFYANAAVDEDGPSQIKRFCSSGTTHPTSTPELPPNFQLLMKAESESPQHECDDSCFSQGIGCHLRHSSSVPDLRGPPNVANSTCSSPHQVATTNSSVLPPGSGTLFSHIISGATNTSANSVTTGSPVIGGSGSSSSGCGQTTPTTGSGTSGNNYLDLSARSSKFQYVLGASTSMAVKLQEETLTYLNQGQSYEIKLKRVGDLSEVRGKVLKTIIRLCFYDRRLQYNERDLIDEWRLQRPNERVMEVDVPLSYGINDVRNDPAHINRIEFTWDPITETGVFIKINSISTEFTPKKHGGEKGVPFRIVIETYSKDITVPPPPPPKSETGYGECLHVASCQVKVFKPKGADRKHKTDREKMNKKPPTEQEKYQNSLDCTVFTDCSLDAFKLSYALNPNQKSPEIVLTSSLNEKVEGKGSHAINGTGTTIATVAAPTSTATTPTTSGATTSATNNATIYQTQASPSGSEKSVMNGFENYISAANSQGSGTTTNNNNNNSSNNDLNNVENAIDLAMFNSFPSASYHSKNGLTSSLNILSPSASVDEAQKWLRANRFETYSPEFCSFTGADLLRLSREDFVSICGLADGLRMYNSLHSKHIKPKLTLLLNFVSYDDDTFYALYLDQLTVAELQSKLTSDLMNTDIRLKQICVLRSSGIKVLVTDDVIRNMPDESIFTVELQKDFNDDYFMLLRPR